ncbi:hypothetical protein CDAR_18791 [Caerostris darwini]|uniref:Uncharacterized protein n=1 Tax=Caerostris darwini TaxID=1538125 RepID=A0AAV4WD56_9ARAC|nr:hypothetical protein CDAR_18791 [Caerostris darwini]
MCSTSSSFMTARCGSKTKHTSLVQFRTNWTRESMRRIYVVVALKYFVRLAYQTGFQTGLFQFSSPAYYPFNEYLNSEAKYTDHSMKILFNSPIQKQNVLPTFNDNLIGFSNAEAQCPEHPIENLLAYPDVQRIGHSVITLANSVTSPIQKPYSPIQNLLPI